MKFVAEQLLGAMRQTPDETDCTVSAQVLEIAGIKGDVAQVDWLNTHRPARGARVWTLIGEHWEYGRPEEENSMIKAGGIDVRPRVPPSTSTQSTIVVRPLVPLSDLSRQPRSTRDPFVVAS